MALLLRHAKLTAVLGLSPMEKARARRKLRMDVLASRRRARQGLHVAPRVAMRTTAKGVSIATALLRARPLVQDALALLRHRCVGILRAVTSMDAQVNCAPS